MKTTIEISDALFAEAKSEAQRRGTSMRYLVEEGLRQLLQQGGTDKPFVLQDGTYDGGGLRPEYLEGGSEAFYEAAYGRWAG